MVQFFGMAAQYLTKKKFEFEFTAVRLVTSLPINHNRKFIKKLWLCQNIYMQFSPSEKMLTKYNAGNRYKVIPFTRLDVHVYRKSYNLPHCLIQN